MVGSHEKNKTNSVGDAKTGPEVKGGSKEAKWLGPTGSEASPRVFCLAYIFQSADSLWCHPVDTSGANLSKPMVKKTLNKNNVGP